MERNRLTTPCLNGTPMGTIDQYCRHHQVKGNNINDCKIMKRDIKKILKMDIEKFIQWELLIKCVAFTIEKT